MLLNIFRKFELKWWQAAMYETAMISLGIFIGARWWDIFIDWVVIFLIIFIVLASYIAYIWFKQVKKY